jgi:surface protein
MNIYVQIKRWWLSFPPIFDAPVFERAYVFNGDLSKWQTSAVTSMYATFRLAKAFNGDLSKWQTNAVTKMRQTFDNAYAFNGDLSKWQTDNVNDMNSIFLDSGFNRTLCGGAWESLAGSNGAFNNLGTSGARYGCCPIGYFMSSPFIAFTEVNSCSQCTAGKYSSNAMNDETSCENCIAGKSNLAGSFDISTCQNCQAGRISDTAGSLCQNCQAGQYQSESGQLQCVPCSVGKFSPDSNSNSDLDRTTNCKLCDKGTYNNQPGQAECKKCIFGKYNTATQSVNEDACLLCGVGTYNDADGLGKACYRCPKANTTGATSCDACPPGKYKELDSVNCIDCSAGQYTDDIDIQTCSKCPTGYHAKNFSTIQDDNPKKKRWVYWLSPW